MKTLSEEEYQEALKICEQLRVYVELENDELTEYCDLLISLISYSSFYGYSFFKTLMKEIKLKLKFYNQNTKIVTENIPQPPALCRKLEWKK